jgi:fatty acid CoA ligase FadD9
VIRLAISERMKPVTYPSTVSGWRWVYRLRRGRRHPDSHAHRSTTATPPGGSSKWAGSKLLRRAHDCAGCRSACSAPMILAYSRFAGQLNVPDAFTRMLISLLATVRSAHFHADDGSGQRPRALL